MLLLILPNNGVIIIAHYIFFHSDVRLLDCSVDICSHLEPADALNVLIGIFHLSATFYYYMTQKWHFLNYSLSKTDNLVVAFQKYTNFIPRWIKSHFFSAVGGQA